MSEDYQKQIEYIHKVFTPFKSNVKRRAQGALIYDYIVPSGYYQEQWDWDGFFIGIALATDIPTEAVFLRNWVLNFIHNARSDGYTPGCITPKGRDERLHQMKPFLAQGAYFASEFLNDYTWLKEVYIKLITIVEYREKHLWNKKYNLGMWFNSMESGADNNLAALDYPNATVIATDLNTYLYREYLALSHIAKALKKTKEEKVYKEKSALIKDNINKYLWDDESKAYFNIDIRDGSFIRRVSFNSIHPLWAGIASKIHAEDFINKYLINSNKLWSIYGIRTLSKDDPGYNNINMIKPYSNWQGPIWPIANYFYMYGLLNYGFKKEAIEVAKRIAKICIDDIKKTGGMHENYDAETGKPLAAPNFVSWNLLVSNMLEDAVSGRTSTLKV